MKNLTRKFGGKDYQYYRWTSSKAGAKAIASKLRKEGWLARWSRTVDEGMGYAIWVRAR